MGVEDPANHVGNRTDDNRNGVQSMMMEKAVLVLLMLMMLLLMLMTQLWDCVGVPAAFPQQAD